MSVLLLRLAAPLQSWGVASRFPRRDTQHYPSKSGIIGLISAARGQRRTDPIEEALLGVGFGVRVDQPGTLTRDFQVAVSLDGRTRYPLSERYYLADAIFLAAIHGEHELLAGIRDALHRPTFPLYLGRRSCPVTESLVHDLSEATLTDALHHTPWQAAGHHRKKQAATVQLPIYRDQSPGDPHDPLQEQVRDIPISFDSARREYGWRTVISDYTTLTNPDSRVSGHDPFASFGGA